MRFENTDFSSPTNTASQNWTDLPISWGIQSLEQSSQQGSEGTFKLGQLKEVSWGTHSRATSVSAPEQWKWAQGGTELGRSGIKSLMGCRDGDETSLISQLDATKLGLYTDHTLDGGCPWEWSVTWGQCNLWLSLVEGNSWRPQMRGTSHHHSQRLGE